MRILLFLIFLVTLTNATFAIENHFDISLDSLLVEKDTEINLNINYKLKGYDEKDFLVKPVVNSGSVYVLNEEWLAGNKLWNQMPYLNKQLKIKFLGGNYTARISLEILNLKNNIIYKSEDLVIWDKSLMERYFNKLQSNILNK